MGFQIDSGDLRTVSDAHRLIAIHSDHHPVHVETWFPVLVSFDEQNRSPLAIGVKGEIEAVFRIQELDPQLQTSAELKILALLRRVVTELAAEFEALLMS